MKLIPWQIRDYVEFRKFFGYFPDLKNPRTMNEKVLYRKRHQCDNEFYTMLADKILVREYVNQKIGSEYLIPLVDCLDNPEEVINNISKYSDSVIKSNHASRMVYVVPDNIDDIDLEQLKFVVSKWMKTDYSKRHGEYQYKNINRKILVEKFIGDKDTLPIDFKVHTFKLKNGKYSYVVEVIESRVNKITRHSFFVNNLLSSFSGDFKFRAYEKEIMQEAIQISRKLLEKLEYARVDWYIIKNKLYFGEITLTPGAGLDKDIKGELDTIMGNMWDLSLAPKL